MRLIDAEKLKQKAWDADTRCGYVQVVDVGDIDDAPTVEERKQGRWVHLGGDEWCCDKCGFVITTEGSWEHPHDIGAKYCQNCGAKMKE